MVMGGPICEGSCGISSNDGISRPYGSALIYGLWFGSYGVSCFMGGGGGGVIVLGRSALGFPLLLPCGLALLGFAERGVEATPSICCLKREKRIRAAWPLEMSSCEATRFQSICPLVYITHLGGIDVPISDPAV